MCRRKYNQDYSPGLLTLPGGILEHEDIYNPTSSLLRELQEEVAIKFKYPQCIALLKEHTGYSTIILISVIIDQECDIHAIINERENEFDKNELFWLEIKNLQTMDESELMEGLSFLKNSL